MKEISPPQGTPPLDSRPQRKKYRPCSLKMGKILHFSACRGEEYFTAPHNTSRRGGFSFTPAPPLPHRQDKTHPTRLHQRPRAKSSPSTAKTAQNQCIFARRAIYSRFGPDPPCWASIFAPMGATAASQHLSIASSKTDDTDAGGSLPRNETADTFASTKRPISGHFPAAKASPVSCTPHRAPAKASPVSSDAK